MKADNDLQARSGLHAHTHTHTLTGAKMPLHAGSYALPSIPWGGLAWDRFCLSGPVPSALQDKGEEQIASLLLRLEV